MLKKMSVEKLLDQLVLIKYFPEKNIRYTRKEVMKELRSRGSSELVKSLVRHAL